MLEHYRVDSDEPKNTGAVFLPVSPSLEQIIKAMRAEGIVHVNEKQGTFRLKPTAESGNSIIIEKCHCYRPIREYRLTRVE